MALHPHVIMVSRPCLLLFVLIRINTGFRLSTHYTATRSLKYYIEHLVEDLHVPGNILLAQDGQLNSWNPSDKKTTRVVGSTWGYQEGIGAEALFRGIAGFTQISPTEVVVVDSNNKCLRNVNRITLQTEQLVGQCESSGYVDGVGNNSRFNRPEHVITDLMSSNHLIVTDQDNDGNAVLRSVDLVTLNVTLFAPITNDTTYISGITQQEDSGNFFVSYDGVGGGTIMMLSYASKALTYITQKDMPCGLNDGPLLEAEFCSPGVLTFLESNVLLATDWNNGRVRALDLKKNKTSSICFGLCDKLRYTEYDFVHSAAVVDDTLYIGLLTSLLAVKAGYEPIFDVEFILLMLEGAVAVLALILSIAALCRVKQRRESVNQRTNVVNVQPMNKSTEFTQTETTRKRNDWTNSDQNMERDA